jgi:hypothetical protein
MAMAEVIVKIPKDAEFLSNASDMDLSLLVSRMLRERLERVCELERALKSSKLTQEQADKLADKISRGLAKRYLKSGE